MPSSRRAMLGYGVLPTPPGTLTLDVSKTVVNDVRTVYKDMGWVSSPVEGIVAQRVGPGYIWNNTPDIHPSSVDDSRNHFRKQNFTQAYLYNDPPDLPGGVSLYKMQAIVRKTPAQYGEDGVSLGNYQPFFTGIPIRSVAPFVESSGFQPISRGPGLLVSITESNRIGGPAAAARMFANTRLGLWFKSWYLGATVRPWNAVQTPSPQFRGVMPNYYSPQLPPIIGS